MVKTLAQTGTSAMAQAMRQINPDVVAAYPITPQTAVVEEFSQMAANGLVKAELVIAESEYSAMSACIGASAAGSRVITATSSAGLALMWELLYVASGCRTPVLMPVVNRALSAPLNIHCDHSDTMGARDAGWIQIFSENAQEAYDNLIQAIRIGEHEKVRLPVMVMMDGFITSHAIERFDILEDDKVAKFVGDFKAISPLLDTDNPVTHGPFDLFDYYFEHKRQQVDAFSNVNDVVKKVAQEYTSVSGRNYGLFKTHQLKDAEIAIVVLSSTGGTAKTVVDKLRKKGVKAGLLVPRVFRPFPAAEIAEALSHLKAVGVMDRSDSFGAQGGPLFIETRHALYDLDKKIPITDYIFGLGGRDIRTEEIENVFKDLEDIASNGKVKQLVNYLGVRE